VASAATRPAKGTLIEVPPRPYWKGFLRLSLVACPIQVFPATSEREKIRFHQINKATGHRIEYRKVDAVTGEPVHDQDIVRGYEIGEGRYIEITEEELEAVAIESAHTIDIDLFVPKTRARMSSRLSRAGRDCSASRCAIRTRFARKSGRSGREVFRQYTR
jgi:hypothetical protein